MRPKLVIQRLWWSWKASPPFLLLIWCLWICAAITCVAGFAGWLYWPVAGLLGLVAIPLLRIVWQVLMTDVQVSRAESVTVFVLLIALVLHAFQVFTPEVGFDAVWYHLPVAKQNVVSHRFMFQSELYQSANPLFSDSVFMLGFMLLGALGTKLIAFVFGVSLLVVVNQLSREYLPRNLALATTALVSTFQVVAWQSASFYIDNAVAFWLCAAVLYGSWWLKTCKTKHLLAVGLLLGSALASKLFLLILVPMTLGTALFTLRRRTIFASMLVAGVALLVTTPMYLFAWYHLGHPLYSLVHHSTSIGGAGSGVSLTQHLVQRILSLPNFLWQIGFTRDYTTPLLILFFPLSVYAVWKKTVQPQHWLLISGAAMLLSVWWFVPPLSTRYGLAGFIGATIFVIAVLHREYKKNAFVLQIVLLALAVVALLPRSYVALKSLRYIAGIETKQEYLQRYLDGNVDTVLMRCHQDVFPTDKTKN